MKSPMPPLRSLLAFAAVLLLAVSLLLPGTGTTLARLFDKEPAGERATVSAQGVNGGSAASYVDYGDWNWFDRQTNETYLELTNNSPTTLVADIRIAEVQLVGTSAQVTAAQNRSKAWIMSSAGTQQAIAANVSGSTTRAAFTPGTLRWTLAPGQSTKVTVGAESNDSVLLSQTLVGLEGLRYEFKFAVDWNIQGLTAAETTALYPAGVLGPQPGDRSRCPVGATDAQGCRGLTATVKKPVITVGEGSANCQFTIRQVSTGRYSLTVLVRPTLAGPAGMQRAAYRREATAPGGTYESYTVPIGADTFSSNEWVKVLEIPGINANNYVLPEIFVIRGRGGTPSPVAGPNGARDAQSPQYRLTTANTGTSTSCSIARLTT